MTKSVPTLRERLLPPLWIFTLAAIWLTFWLLSELREILSLLVVGYAIAYVIEPAQVMLGRRRISRTVGFFCIFGVFLIVGLLLAGTAVPTIAKQYDVLSVNLPSYIDQAKQRILGHLARFDIPVSNLDLRGMLDQLPTPTGETLKGFLAGAGTALLQGYNITMTLLNLFLLPFIVFYLSIDFPQLHQRLLNLVRAPYRKKVVGLAGEINRDLSAFVRGQFMVGCILTVLYMIGLGAFVGVDLWLLLSVISGFGNMVPYLGSLIGIALGVVMALVTFGDLSHVVYVLIVYVVVQFLEGTFITPKIVGESVGLSPLLVILALFAGGQLLGILGLVLAIPITAALRVLLRHGYHAVVHQ